MLLEDAFNQNSIQLEPRLQEYMAKKKFNEENHISPSISEELEFCITPHDISLIKNSKKKKKSNCKMHDQFIEPDITSLQTLDFKSDSRYNRLQKKNAANAKARTEITNMSHMDPEYTIFHQSNPFQGKSRNDKGLQEPINNGMYLDSRDLVIGPSRPYTDKHDRNKYCYNINKKQNKNPNVYNNPPKISYNQYLQPELPNDGFNNITPGFSGVKTDGAKQNESLIYENQHKGRNTNYSAVDVIEKLDKYNDHLDETYFYNQTEMLGTPSVNIETQRGTAFAHKSVPFMFGNGYPDVSVEEALRGGYVDSSKKSVGFRNAFENQFSYIADDICDPDHTVMAWPVNSRGTNKQIARAGRFR